MFLTFLFDLIYIYLGKLLSTVKSRLCPPSIWQSDQVTHGIFFWIPQKLSVHFNMFNFLAITKV